MVRTRVAVEVPAAARVTLPGVMEQVPLVGIPEQVRLTAPLKAAFADRLRVAMAVEPMATDKVAGVPDRENAGVRAATVRVEGADVAGLKLVSPE